jgi:hypothetical protein
MCNQYMEQANDAVDGDHWIRYRGICGADPEYYYDLRTVYTTEGEDTRFTKYVELEAPKQVMITF